MSAKKRLPAILAIATLAITTVFLFHPLFVGLVKGEPRFFEWDVPEQYWGDLVFLCRSLHHADLPYWNPYDRGGYPYFADPQASAYHPLAWGMCLVGGESPGLSWQEARVVVGFACAGGFGLLWLRRLGASFAAATLGAIVIECAPFMRHNWELNLTAALGWLPMVLWALERLFAHRRAQDVALVALAEALLVWTGSPPVAWFAGSFTAVYVLGRVIEIGRSSERPILVRTLGLLSASGAVALALSAVVLVPGLELAKQSVQAGRSYASLAEGGLELSQAVALVWPQEGNHLYVGLLPLALAPIAFLRKEKLPGRVALAVAAILAVLLALGDHGPLFPIAFRIVPGVKLFRLPHRYESWLGPAIGALAAGGFDAVRQRLAARSPRFDSPRSTAVLAVVLPLLIVLDVTRRMPEERHTRPRPAPGGPAAVADILPRAPDTEVHWRYLDEFGISCRSGTRLGHRDFRGYQDPLLLEEYEKIVDSLREHPQLAPQYNVRYVLTSPHFIHGWDHHYLPPPDELRALPGTIDRGAGVFELSNTMPFAYVVPANVVDHAATRDDALDRTKALAPAPLAILEDGKTEHASGVAPSVVSAEVTSFATDDLSLRAHADEASVLVVNEAWYPGWRAWVDGAEVPVVRANGFARAVALGPGDHVVTMRFVPRGGATLRWIMAGAWVIVVALFASGRLRRRSSSSPDQPTLQ